MNTEKISLSDRVTARNDVYSTSVDGELVIFDPLQGTYFGSGIVGTAIWDRLSDDKTVADICCELMDAFSVDETTCHRDVLKFLGEAIERGLIVVHSDR